MSRRYFRFASLAVLGLAGALSACSGGGSLPQTANPPGSTAPNPGTPPVDTSAAIGTVKYTHYQKAATQSSSTQIQSVTANSPFDLTYFGGPFLKSVLSHNVYLNCAATCWGTPGRGTASTFLDNFANSNIAHVTDQYVGATASGRYTRAPDINFKSSLPHIVTVSDILKITHAAAVAAHASGFGHIYHLFFPKGTDVCLTSTVCYSPDNPSTFVFCAFHSSVDFNDIGHVLLSVEPYQFVGGCFLPRAVPHGVIDATASTLSHELTETITDPDGNAWFNTFFGDEIGDQCAGFSTNISLSGTFYNIQSEYSNARSDCVNGV